MNPVVMRKSVVITGRMTRGRERIADGQRGCRAIENQPGPDTKDDPGRRSPCSQGRPGVPNPHDKHQGLHGKQSDVKSDPPLAYDRQGITFTDSQTFDQPP